MIGAKFDCCQRSSWEGINGINDRSTIKPEVVHASRESPTFNRKAKVVFKFSFNFEFSFISVILSQF